MKALSIEIQMNGLAQGWVNISSHQGPHGYSEYHLQAAYSKLQRQNRGIQGNTKELIVERE